MHICRRVPWDLISELQLDLLSFDAALHGLALDARPALEALLHCGGRIAWEVLEPAGPGRARTGQRARRRLAIRTSLRPSATRDGRQVESAHAIMRDREPLADRRATHSRRRSTPRSTRPAAPSQHWPPGRTPRASAALASQGPRAPRTAGGPRQRKVGSPARGQGTQTSLFAPRQRVQRIDGVLRTSTPATRSPSGRLKDSSRALPTDDGQARRLSVGSRSLTSGDARALPSPPIRPVVVRCRSVNGSDDTFASTREQGHAGSCRVKRSGATTPPRSRWR